MQVRLLCGAHVVWDCLFTTGYPGFGVPVPLFIGYLISNLILLKTNLPTAVYNFKLKYFDDMNHESPKLTNKRKVLLSGLSERTCLGWWSWIIAHPM